MIELRRRVGNVKRLRARLDDDSALRSSLQQETQTRRRDPTLEQDLPFFRPDAYL